MKNFFNFSSQLFTAGLLLFSCATGTLHAQSNNNMGIGTTTPDASAILDVYSNTKGLLIPRPSTAPANPTAGLMYYGGGRVNYFDGSVWRPTGLWSLNGVNARYTAGNVETLGGFLMNNTSPTVYFQDTDQRSGFIHQNGDLMHFLSGGINANTWTINGNQWPLTINMATDAATFGGPAYFMEGNVGIGTSSPGGYRLAIIHDNFFGMKIQNVFAGADYWEIFQTSAAAGDLNLYAGINYVGAFNFASGAYSAVSDERLKDNIMAMKNVLPSLLQLAAKSYSFKSDLKKEQKLGFIAQDVEKLFPELVTMPIMSEKGETPYTMNYAGFGIIAVKAIQEQQVIIETQAKKIEAQQAEIDAIKTALAKAGIKLD